MQKAKNLSAVELETIAAYNHIAGIYEEYEGPLLWDESVHYFSRRLKTGFSVLDLGCGIGRAIPLLESLGMATYKGVDASENMLLQARRKYPEYVFELVDFYSLDKAFRPNQFETFYASASLMHVPREKMPLALRSLRTVMTDNAIGYIAVPYGTDHFTYRGYVDQKFDMGVTVFRWTPLTFEPFFNEAGFKIEDALIYRGEMLYLIVRST